MSARNRWFDDWVRLTLERDVRELAKVQQAAMLPRLAARVAAQTGQILNTAKLAKELQAPERTVDGYLRLLEARFLFHRIPAWGTTSSARATSKPKVHLVDTGVAARLLRLSREKLAAKSASATTDFGHLLETFVVGEVMKQASWLDEAVDVCHWRTRDGDEVDLVLERDDGSIIAIEVKAAQRVRIGDLASLRKLRDTVGDAFVAGVALYLGPHPYTYNDRIHVMPISRLWTSH